MKLTEKQLRIINETNKFIIDWCEYFQDFEEDLIFSDERIKEIIEEEDVDDIGYDFPGVDNYTEIEPSIILELSKEIQTIKIENKSLIKTESRRYYIVRASDSTEDYFIREYHDVQMTSLEGIEINLANESFIVGLAATKLEEYDKEYWGTINQYLVIEIIYKNKESVLDSEKEKDLLNSYIFEVADSAGIALNLSEIKNPVDEFEELREEAEENYTHSLRELEPFNEGMKLFVSAIQIKDPELKFLNFYKVLEHFSPIAVNIEANELMRKKLDSPKSSFEDGDFIRSIFELANTMRDRFNDEDLIKASFNTCFDFIGLFKYLPESVKKKVRNHLGGQELNYSTEKQKVTTSNNIAAKIIYKTRNKVVHAKSNFTLTGDEINFKEMDQLNIFMKEASSQAIRWYTRQPKHMKLEIIK
jgi:hypothetical protein